MLSDVFIYSFTIPGIPRRYGGSSLYHGLSKQTNEQITRISALLAGTQLIQPALLPWLTKHTTLNWI
jgi:hypothetical protein